LGVLIFAIGTIGDQCICVADKGGQFLDVGAVVKTARFWEKLIVGDVADGAVFVIDPVSQAISRVIEQHRLDFNTVEAESAFFQVLKGHSSSEFFDFNRKIDTIHLTGNQLPYGNVPMGRSHDFKFVALSVERGKKGQGIDVIPMGVGNEYLGLGLGAVLGFQVIRQGFYTCSRIEDK